MRILKRIIIIILILIAIPLIVALFVKKDYAVEKEITINKPKQVVFDYIKMLKNQDNYSVWATRDPNMKRTYTGTDGTPGFISAWESKSKDVGSGEQEILKVAEGDRVDSKLRFKEPFEAQADAYMTTEAVGENQTKVKWGFKGATPYPFNIMNLFINMDEAVGKDFMTGLSNLKTVLEQQ
jgi:hypothetical protein